MSLQLQLGIIIGISIIFCTVYAFIRLHQRRDDDIDEDFFYLEKLCEGGEFNEKK